MCARDGGDGSRRCGMVMSLRMFLAASGAEGAHAFQVADDSCCVIDIGRSAFRAMKQRPLVKMSTLITDGQANVRAEVIAPGRRREIDQTLEVRGGQGFV